MLCIAASFGRSHGCEWLWGRRLLLLPVGRGAHRGRPRASDRMDLYSCHHGELVSTGDVVSSWLSNMARIFSGGKSIEKNGGIVWQTMELMTPEDDFWGLGEDFKGMTSGGLDLDLLIFRRIDSSHVWPKLGSFHQEGRGFIMGLWATNSNVGDIFGLHVSSLLLDTVGWYVILWVLAGAGMDP